MSDDNPFASDPTVIRPNPGGRRPAGPAVPQAGPAPADATVFGAPQAARPASANPFGAAPAATSIGGFGSAPQPGGVAADPATVPGMGPLVTAAGPLLALVGWLRLLPAHQNVSGLRQRLVADFQAFDRAALRAGQSELAVREADYILCATFDDVIANTPWGMEADWARQSLARTIHNDATGGEAVFRLLDKYRQDPAGQIAGIELLYFCLSLGFQGKLRISQQGGAEMVQLRENLHRLLRQYRGERQADLSPHWRGVEGGKSLSFSLPLWAVAAAAAVIVTAAYFGFSYELNDLSDQAYTAIAKLPPTSIVEAPAPAFVASAPTPAAPPPLDVDRVSGFLKPEIAQNLVTVFDDGHNTVVRIVGSGMFASGSASVESSFLPMLGRIADALVDTHGTVLITGHTDNQPIHSLKFPSNFDLSTARAKAVTDIIAAKAPAVAPRLSSEGRADSDPVAPNTTPEGRQRNRRIDLIVPRPLETVQ
jgi:type VI secretion system protein ImpK